MQLLVVIVSFRGTEMDSLKNWIDDLGKTKLIRIYSTQSIIFKIMIDTAETTPYNDVPNAEVHEGFYTAYEGNTQ